MKKNTQQTIANLLRKADSVAGTPEEKAFRQKALELMAKYNFDEATVRSKTNDKAQIICDEIEFSGTYIDSQQTLFHVIANHFGCKVISLDNKTIEVFGTESAVEQVDWLFDLLWIQALSGCLNGNIPDWYSGPEKTKWRKSFLHGFILDIRDRFAEITRKAKNDDSQKAGQLVLLDDAARAWDALKSMHPNVRTVNRRRSYNASGMAAGSKAARNSDIGQGRVAGQRAIGA